MERDSRFELEEYAVKKSKALNAAKYKMTGLAIDITNVAMTRIQKENVNGVGKLVARLYPQDINKFVHKGHNIYRDLEKAALTMVGQIILIENPDGFKVFSIIPKVNYENHILEVEFSEELKPHLYLDTNAKHTTENIAITAMLNKPYTKRLYELLQDYTYRIKDDEPFHVFFNISELRFCLGIANINEEKVRNALNKYKTADEIDWDYLFEEVVVEKQYADWDKLKSQVLEVARKDCEENSDISFEYIPYREGHKYRRIEFIISRNKNVKRKDWRKLLSGKVDYLEKGRTVDLSEGQISIFDVKYTKAQSYIGENGLTQQDIEILLSDANYDEDLVCEAIEYAKSKKYTKNFVGYIRNIITKKQTEEFEEPVETYMGSSKKAEELHAFEEMYEESHTPEAEEARWEKIKAGQYYEEFKDAFKFSDETLNILPAAQKNQIFMDWKLKNKKVGF